MAKRAGQRRNPNSPRVKTRRMRMSFCDLEFDRTWNCKSRYRRVSRRSSVWMRPCVLRSGRSSVCRWQPHIVSISLLQTGAHGPKLLLCSTAAEVPRPRPTTTRACESKALSFQHFGFNIDQRSLSLFCPSFCYVVVFVESRTWFTRQVWCLQWHQPPALHVDPSPNDPSESSCLQHRLPLQSDAQFCKSWSSMDLSTSSK